MIAAPFVVGWRSLQASGNVGELGVCDGAPRQGCRLRASFCLVLGLSGRIVVCWEWYSPPRSALQLKYNVRLGWRVVLIGEESEDRDEASGFRGNSLIPINNEKCIF